MSHVFLQGNVDDHISLRFTNIFDVVTTILIFTRTIEQRDANKKKTNSDDSDDEEYKNEDHDLLVNLMTGNINQNALNNVGGNDDEDRDDDDEDDDSDLFGHDEEVIIMY